MSGAGLERPARPPEGPPATAWSRAAANRGHPLPRAGGWGEGAPVKRIGLLALGFAYMVLLIEALHAAVTWWRDERAQPGWSDIALIGALPPDPGKSIK